MTTLIQVVTAISKSLVSIADSLSSINDHLSVLANDSQERIWERNRR